MTVKTGSLILTFNFLLPQSFRPANSSFLATTATPESRHGKNGRPKVGVHRVSAGEIRLKEPQKVVGRQRSVCAAIQRQSLA